MDGKTFLLGVGCQKGGTSWLHDYLSQSDRTNFGLIKEYHIFDELDLRSAEHQAQVMAKLKQRAERNADGEVIAARLRYDFRLNTEQYFDYFTGLLSGEVMLTGDITPSYSGLSAERFSAIREGFAARGVTTRVIFLMRDPVERIWSAARMALWGDKATRRNPDAPKTGDEATMLRTYRTDAVRFRTNYHRTIAALEQAFSPEEMLFGFYETLFTPEATERICSFLRIPYIEPQFGKTVNTSPKMTEISPETARRVARAYADVYRFATERFGKEFIASIWPHLHHARV